MATTPELIDSLTQVHDANKNVEPRGPYVYAHPIAWYDAKPRDICRDYVEHPDLQHTVNQFLRGEGGSKKSQGAQIALFSTWANTWVGKTNAQLFTVDEHTGEKTFDQSSWHAWAAGIIRTSNTGYGKSIVIWDCDANSDNEAEGKRIRDVLLGPQRRFAEYCSKPKSQGGAGYNVEHFYVARIENLGKGKSAESTCAWIRKLCGIEDFTMEDMGKIGPLQGLVELRK